MDGATFCASHRSAASDDPAFLDQLFGKKDDAFNSADGLHLYLRRLSRAVAEGRLDSRQANSLAYIGQLLLNSLTNVLDEQERLQDEQREEEIQRAYARLKV